MQRPILTITLILTGVATAAAAADDSYRVVDHLQIVKTSDSRTNPVQPATLTGDVTRDDIAAAQKCKDLGPASNDPDVEADIINSCLARNSIMNIKITSNQTRIKAVLQ